MDKDQEKYKTLINDANKKSSTVRGLFLNQVAFLETTIDIFLATHFCKSDTGRNDFLQLVMPSNIITLENKRILFNKIVIKYYPTLKDKKPNYHAFLEKVLKCRNKFAHYQLDVTPNGIEQFQKTKNIFLINNVKESEQFIVADILALAEEIRDFSIDISNAITI